MTSAPEAYRVVPADHASWDDLRTVFGTRGTGQRCWCQRYKLARGESFGSVPAGGPGRSTATPDRLRRSGTRASQVTSGLVAYAGEEPVGWCAVEPRPAYAGLLRVYRIPWEGRDEDRHDETVWAVTCLFVRAGHRRRGVSRALAAAAVGHARDHGARALEAYPMTTTAAIAEELHVGTVSTFAAAGLEVVSAPHPAASSCASNSPDVGRSPAGLGRAILTAC